MHCDSWVIVLEHQHMNQDKRYTNTVASAYTYIYHGLRRYTPSIAVFIYTKLIF